MSETIGRVDITVDFDGRDLPRQAREAAEGAGKESGKGYNKAFNKELSENGQELEKVLKKQADKNGGTFAKTFGEAMRNQIRSDNGKLSDELARAFKDRKGIDEYAKSFTSSKDAAESLRKKLDELKKQGLITDEEFKKSKKSVTDWYREQRKAATAAERTAHSIKVLGNQTAIARAEIGKEIEKEIQTRERAARIQSNLNLISQSELKEALRGEIQRREEAERMEKVYERERAVRYLHDLRKNSDEANRSELERLTTARRANTFDHTRIATGGLVMRSLDEQNRHLDDHIRILRGETRTLEESDREHQEHIKWIHRMGEENDKASGKQRGLNNNLRQMPYALRTIAGYTALFAGLAPAIATLGSVAGSSLAVIAAGALALGVGVAVAIAGIKGITGPLDKVAASARPAAQALKDMKAPLHEIQQTIQGHIFDGLTGPIKDLTNKLLPLLNTKLAGVADSVGDFFAGIANGLSSKNGLRDVGTLLDGFKPILKNLGDAVINLGAAFGSIFVAALPSLKTFSGFLATLFGDFNKFLRSADGQSALATFFKHLNDLAGPLAGLLGAAGKALAGMVTEKSVANLTEFLDTMSQVFPGITDLVNIIGDLDPLGIVAEAIKAITDAISENKGPLSDFATSLGDLFKDTLKELAPVLSDIVKELIPLGKALVDTLGKKEVMKSASDILSDIVTKILPPLVQILIDVLPPLATFADFTAKTLPPLLDMAAFILKLLDPIAQFGAFMVQFLIDPMSMAKQTILDLAGNLLGFGTKLTPVEEGLKTVAFFVGDLQRTITLFGIAAGGIINSFVTAFVSAPGRIFSGFTGFIAHLVSLVNIDPRIPPIVNAAIATFGGLPGFVFSKVSGFITGMISRLDFSHGIPGIVNSAVTEFASLPGRVLASIAGFASQVNEKLKFKMSLTGDGGIISRIQTVLGALRSVAGNFIAHIGSTGGVPKTATGGAFDGAQLRVIGEAGPEAVVPLRRPLNQVDPAVRALSAIAQGKSFTGESGVSKQIVVQDGAIRVTVPATNPDLVGSAILDHLIADLPI